MNFDDGSGFGYDQINVNMPTLDNPVSHVKYLPKKNEQNNLYSYDSVIKRQRKNEIRKNIEDFFKNNEVSTNNKENFTDNNKCNSCTKNNILEKSPSNMTLIIIIVVLSILYFIQYIQMQSMNDTLKNLILIKTMKTIKSN